MKTLTTLIISMFLVLTAGCSATGQARAADNDYFTQAELDSMLAPVALYPDSVLSHVLIAATYPLEVIQAARWTRQHPGLRGEDAVAAVEHRNWDPSVKALVAFPDLLERMDDDLDWTQRLGDAFLLQEEEVIASIQYLRSEAYSQGHLRSNDRVKIVREKEYIYIEPARTRVVYVPYYDPRVIYKRWRWSSYEPYYWHRPSGFSVSVNFHWGRPYHIRPSFYFSSFHWPTRKVVVVNHHHHYYRDRRFHSGRDVAHFKEARHWKHDPTHRRGVSYRGRVEQSRFVESARTASARANSKSVSRASVRSDRRDWAAQRRSSESFDRESRSRDRSASRSQRVAELRGSRSETRESSSISSRSATRTASRERGESGLQARRSERSSSRESSTRTVTGRAPARAESRSRDAASSRSSATRASRVSESLRSSSSSRAADRASSSRLSSSRSSRTESDRSSISIPDGLSVRSSSRRERSSAPSRSQGARSVSPSRSSSLSRDSAPSRQSAPSRSRSNDRGSSSSRATPRTRSSAPSRSSKSAPSRSSRGASVRSSRESASSRSRGGESRRGSGDSRRGGGRDRGEERR